MENFASITDGNHEMSVVEKTKEQVLEMLKSTIRPEFPQPTDEDYNVYPLNEREIPGYRWYPGEFTKKMLGYQRCKILEVTPRRL